MSSSELVQRLRAADAALAAMAPAADLEARIRARARGRGTPRLSSILVGARRLHRPLILAFATAAALSVVSIAVVRGRGPVASSMVAGGPEDPAEHIVNDRSRADGGVGEARPGAGPRPVFHMPALEPGPRRDDPPVSPQRPAASPPALAPSALTPSTLKPSSMTPARWSEDVNDGVRRPSRIDAYRPAVSSIGRPAALASTPGTPAFRPSFVARGGGEIAVHDASSSTSHGGDGAMGTVDCRTPSALWDVAVGKCEATGQVLSTFTFLEPCSDGRFGSIYFQCADPEPEPEPDPAPDPEPEPDQCISRAFGGGETCVDLAGFDKDPIAGIEQKASAACAELGLALGTLSVDAVGCPVQSGKVKYVCCPGPAPTPPLPDLSCQEDKIGSDTCVDLATLKAAASTRCAEIGRVLTSLSPLAGCPDDQASVALITCCPESL
jgi:hypothetical protein